MHAMSWGACICRKRQYRSKREARAVAAKVRKDGEHVEAYHCPFDQRLWHIGHRPPRLPRTRELLRAQVRRARRIEVADAG
jgi:hypothetical protein